jgi:uncharacterized membrane protein
VTEAEPDEKREDDQSLEPQSGEVLDPNAVEERAVRRAIEFFEARLHAGPLPDAEEYGAYDHVLPGTAQVIRDEWQLEAANRRQLQTEMVRANIRWRTRGQYFAAFLVFLIVVGSFAAIFTGKSIAGIATLVLAAAALSSRFLGRGNGNGGGGAAIDQPQLPPTPEAPNA